MSLEDATLVARVVVDDDRHAFLLLVKRHEGAVRAFVRRLAKDDALADDIAQDTFVKAYGALAQWRRQGSLKSWLFQIAYHAFVSEKRKARHAKEVLVDDDAHAEAAHAMPDVGARADVERALATLRDDERAAVVLCVQESLTHEEAARVLDLPLGTVKSHVARGKEKLRALLSSHLAGRSSSRASPDASDVHGLGSVPARAEGT